MTARLNITTDGTTSVYATNFVADLQKSFNDFISRFDYTTGTVTIRLSYTQDASYALSSAPDSMTAVGNNGNTTVQENSPLSGLLGGTGTGPMSGVLYVSDPYIHNVYEPGGPWSWDIGRSTTHELLHILGNDFSEYDRITHQVGPMETLYDTNVQFDSAGNAYFNGANAQSVYGGLVPLDRSIDHSNFSMVTLSNVNHMGSVMDYDQDSANPLHGWTAFAITPLDVAMMKDDGVPALTDNERDEHFWTRACDVLFHHQVTTSAIEAWAKILEANAGDLVGTAGQFLGLLGIHSMTGGQLVDAANSDAERLKLAADPTAYSHTMEQEITRIYQLATGQFIDPWHYNAALKAALGSPINAETLQTKVAPIFLQSAESAACFSHDVDHKAAVEHVLANAGINGWNSFPAASKAILLAIPMPDLVVALADNGTCIQHQLGFSATWAGPQPGELPGLSINLPHV